MPLALSENKQILLYILILYSSRMTCNKNLQRAFHERKDVAPISSVYMKITYV